MTLLTIIAALAAVACVVVVVKAWRLLREADRAMALLSRPPVGRVDDGDEKSSG